MGKYMKAIVAGAATVVATIYVVVTEGEPGEIPNMTTAIVGAIMTLLVYFVPNSPD